MTRSFRIKFLSVFAALVVGSTLAGCKHKDRLTSNYFNFTITPPAATVVKDTPLTLTANAGGTAEISPIWEVTPTTAGTFNPAVGRQVIFTPTVLGDAVVLATFDGVQAQSQVAVVTYITNSNTFDVYTDLGLPYESGILSDIFVGALTINEISTGYTPEGLKYEQATGSTGAFWGVTLDKNLINQSKDLSAFSTGSLKFAIHLGRTLGPTEKIEIHIDDDGTGLSPGKVDNISTDFMNELSTDWQEVTIPISSFAPAQNLVTTHVPFAIVLANVPTSLTFDVDVVRWEK